jgi:hypothetical protein
MCDVFDHIDLLVDAVESLDHRPGMALAGVIDDHDLERSVALIGDALKRRSEPLIPVICRDNHRDQRHRFLMIA